MKKVFSILLVVALFVATSVNAQKLIKASGTYAPNYEAESTFPEFGFTASIADLMTTMPKELKVSNYSFIYMDVLHTSSIIGNRPAPPSAKFKFDNSGSVKKITTVSGTVLYDHAKGYSYPGVIADGTNVRMELSHSPRALSYVFTCEEVNSVNGKVGFDELSGIRAEFEKGENIVLVAGYNPIPGEDKLYLGVNIIDKTGKVIGGVLKKSIATGIQTWTINSGKLKTGTYTIEVTRILDAVNGGTGPIKTHKVDIVEYN